MPIISIRDLGLKGILPDAPAYDLPPEGLTNCLNMRIKDRKLQRTTGWSTFLDLTVDFTEVFGTFIYPVYAIPIFGDNDEIIIIASDQYDPVGGVNQSVDVKFFSFDGTSVIDISPAIDRTGTAWQWRDIDNGLIVNNGTTTPMIYTQDKTQFEDIANFPASTSCKVFVKYKEFYVGLNVTEGGKTFRNKIIWSGVINPDNNEADWSFADPASLAGFNYIADDIRGIQEVAELNDQLFVYTFKKITSMQFTGDQFVFRFRDVIEDGGAIGPNLVVELENTQMAISSDDVYIQDGNTKKSISVGRVRNELFNRASSLETIKMYKNQIDNEIIIAFREGETAGFNLAIVYSFDYDGYTIIQLPSITDYNVGVEISLDISTWDNIDQAKSWDVESNSWSSVGGVTNKLKPYGASPINNKIYLLDDTWRQDGAEYTSLITRTNIDFDNVFGDSSQLKSVQKVWPQFAGDGTVRVRFGGSNFPNGNISWDSYFDNIINNDDEVDARTTARYIAFQATKESGGAWEATGIDIELVTAGRR